MICDICKGRTQIRVTSTIEKIDKKGNFYNSLGGICPICIVREAKIQPFVADRLRKMEKENE